MSQSTSPGPAAAVAPLVALDQVSQRFGDRGAPGWFERALRQLRLSRPGPVTHAVDSVSLAVQPGEVVGLVGESGCGKSTLGRMAAGLLHPTEGTVRVDGVAWPDMTPAQKLAARLRIQMVFQDPFASLNPRLRVSRIVGEAPRVHGLTDDAGLDDYVCAQLERAGLDPALRHRYPHQFSGGQRQRIGIARALAVQPGMLVCDEAVAALDVSIQAQILNLFMDLRDRLGPDLPVHQPRPGRDRACVRPRGGHVPGPSGRDGPGRRAVCTAAPPLHPRPCWQKSRGSTSAAPVSAR
jgi:peptide/nickel transport system ATP-binding protein